MMIIKYQLVLHEANGTSEITLEEINAEIEAAREERRVGKIDI